MVGSGVKSEKTTVAALSVLSNTFLTLGKITVGFISGSMSILSEGIHSGMDLIAAIIALLAVKQSEKPADDRHAYGHGKFENVSGTMEALLIFIAAAWIIYEAASKFTTGVHIDQFGLGIVVMGASALINLVVSTLLFRVAKKTDSIALEADALHLRTDVYTSGGVFIGLIIMKLTGWSILDPIIAIAVALLIIKAAYNLTKEAFMPLVDTTLPEEEYLAITNILEVHAHNFIEFHQLRTRKSGSERYIDLHLVVPSQEPVKKVHDLCDHLEEEINKQLPRTHVLIHFEPCSERLGPCSHCVGCEQKLKEVKISSE